MRPPLVIAVTVLSSSRARPGASVEMAVASIEAGADGVVVSGDDVGRVRAACGDGAMLVVPGIRPAGSDAGDQVRVLTPRAAVDAGADRIVVGRPITGASDPVAAARDIVASLR